MSRPAKYRKRPVVIEAVQYRPGPGGNCSEIRTFLGGVARDCDPACDATATWLIPTPEGEMLASPGDWVIRGVSGEFYPYKPDIFAKTYEAVAE